MLIFIEVVSALVGIGLMLYGMFNSIECIIAGIVVGVLGSIISTVGHWIKYSIITDEVLSSGGSPNDPRIKKAKLDAIGATARTTLVATSAYSSTKKAVKEIGHPETWGKV